MRRQPFYHLTLDAREVIAEGIVNSDLLSVIARQIGKHPTSVSNEVKHYRISAGRATARITNICVQAKSCTRKKLCSDVCKKQSGCAHCLTRHCFDFCPDFEEAICPRTERWPYVCNGCNDRTHCGFERYYYRPSVAQAEADRIKSESRSGISLSKEELLTLDDLITPLLRDNKQSPEVICNNNPEAISVSPQTLRRYIDNGHMRSIRLNLLSAPSRKVRQKPKPKASKHIQDERSYADFLSLPQQIQDVAWEMDTVFGAKEDSTCLLTLINRKNLLFFPFKMRQADTECVADTLDYLEVLCQEAGMDFEEMFPVILTDNGFEFCNSDAIESSCLYEAKRTRLYYCDPYSSWQKPYVEGRHTLLRRILPKGQSLKGVTHAQIAKAASHINSYPAMSRAGLTPFDMAYETIPDELFKALGMLRINRNEVALTRDMFYR